MTAAPDRRRREGAICALVRRAYEDPAVVARYTTVGLWPAEEILVADFVPEGARLLDLGCGAGRASVALAELGLRVLGIDISAPMVEVARHQARLAGVEDLASFQVMDARRLDLPAESFDAALYSYNGIELVPGLEGKRRVLAEAARVLVPGGRLLLCAHSLFAINAHAPMRLRAFGRLLLGRLGGIPVREQELGERFLDDEGEEARYLQVLPPGRYRRLLRDAGFEVLYFNTRPRIEAGRPYRAWAGLGDGERFFVAQKRSPQAGPP